MMLISCYCISWFSWFSMIFHDFSWFFMNFHYFFLCFFIFCMTNKMQLIMVSYQGNICFDMFFNIFNDILWCLGINIDKLLMFTWCYWISWFSWFFMIFHYFSCFFIIFHDFFCFTISKYNYDKQNT